MRAAPNRYDYATDAEFDAAMREWCAENEPFHRVTYWDAEALCWKERDFAYLHEARAFWRERRRDDLLRDDCRRASITTRYPSAFGDTTRNYCAPGTWPPSRRFGCANDHLDGGSRDDYRMAGYTRY